MSAYTVWYREGTIAVQTNTKAVSGVATYWVSAGINPGDMFTTDGSNFYEVESVTDSSHLTLKTNYTGATLTSGKYAVIRNFNSGMSARVASLAAQLLGYFDKYIDSDMKSIHGKSAYECAIDSGYVGTQAEWLESLKAAGEWESASARLLGLETAKEANDTLLEEHSTDLASLKDITALLKYDNPGFHNSIFRGKNLGTEITAEQSEAIQKGTYHDMFIGDYWMINGVMYRIVHFDVAFMGGGSQAQLYNVILWQYGVTGWSCWYASGENYSGGFVNSIPYQEDGAYWKCRNRIIEDFGGSEHFQNSSDPNGTIFTHSSAVDENGRITAAVGVSGEQIGLPCLRNFMGGGFYQDGGIVAELYQAQTRSMQFNFFKYYGRKAHVPYAWDNCTFDSFSSQTARITWNGGKCVSWQGVTQHSEIKPLIAIVR